MDELIALAQEAGKGDEAKVTLHNLLGGSKCRNDAFRKAVLKMATDEERRLYDFAASLEPHFGRGGFEVLLSIASRHA